MTRLRTVSLAAAALLAGCATTSEVAPPQAETPAPSATSGGFTPDANLPRAEVPDTYKWDLTDLFESDDAWREAVAASAEDRKVLQGYAGKLSDPQVLAQALERYLEARLRANQITLYAGLRHDTDAKAPEPAAMYAEGLQVIQDFMADTVFIRQELLAYDAAAMEGAYEAVPALADLKPYIEELRRRRTRVRSPDAEEALSLLGDNLWAEIDLNELPSGYERAFASLLGSLPLPTITDENGETVQLTLSNFGRFRASKDRAVRKAAVEGLFGTLRQFDDAFAATYAGQVGLDVAYARARGYDTALAAYLDKDRLEPAVFEAMVSAIRDNVAPLHRYVSLRKKVLGLDEVHVYDLYVSMVPQAAPEVPYEQAVDTLVTALAPLGEEYVAVMARGLDPANGWVDVYPNADKESGAFCASVYGTHPYVKMNYMNDWDGMSTLAHEYGHALHAWLTMENQPYVTFGYPSLTAEIASTFNEKLLVDQLLAQADTREEKLMLLGELAETLRTTIYRQALFSEFEWRAHQAAEAGQPLTAEWLNDTYGSLIAHYYGPDFTLGEHDPVEWAYVPHFYYKYYMYSYALGLSAGIALAEKVQEGGPEARDAYLGMLKAGASKPPIEAIRDAGVDLTTPEAVVAAARLLDRTVTELETLLGEAE